MVTRMVTEVVVQLRCAELDSRVVMSMNTDDRVQSTMTEDVCRLYASTRRRINGNYLHNRMDRLDRVNSTMMISIDNDALRTSCDLELLSVNENGRTPSVLVVTKDAIR